MLNWLRSKPNPSPAEAALAFSQATNRNLLITIAEAANDPNSPAHANACRFIVENADLLRNLAAVMPDMDWLPPIVDREVRLAEYMNGIATPSKNVTKPHPA